MGYTLELSDKVQVIDNRFIIASLWYLLENPEASDEITVSIVDMDDLSEEQQEELHQAWKEYWKENNQSFSC